MIYYIIKYKISYLYIENIIIDIKEENNKFVINDFLRIYYYNIIN